MPDYVRAAAAFRAKAAATPYPEEAKILIAKAEELETKYGNHNSTSTDDTTTTSRDGNSFTGSFTFRTGPEWDALFEKLRRQAAGQRAQRIAEDLLREQWRWNEKYYDRDGKPKPGYGDADDLIADQYKHDPPEDEDYGYDEFEREDYDAE